MVTPQENGESIGANQTAGLCVNLAANGHHLGQVTHFALAQFNRAIGAHRGLVAAGRGNIPQITHGEPQLFQSLEQAGIAHRAGAHIHPAALLPQIHGDAQNHGLAHAVAALFVHGHSGHYTRRCRTLPTPPFATLRKWG